LLIEKFSVIFSFSSNWDRAMTDDIMTVRELAGYLKLNEKTAYRLVSEGKIPGFKVGGSWRFKRAEIENWIEVQSSKPEKDRE